ncbi:MAG TPA: penicillin-binding transpeptidase domain-containing protein [Clostridia bacterium]|nr:penicillin-binding transpeptidase domain-containing protein [Clostridia bacterium]
MLIFDQLKKEDPQLRVVTAVILAGLSVLLIGLWWVQIVSAQEYRESLETQSFRTVRIPAVRGKILDRGGNILAENRPSYNISLYLEELRKPFDQAYSSQVKQTRAQRQEEMRREEQKLGREFTKKERAKYGLSMSEKMQIRQRTRYQVASNVVAQIGQRIQQPLTLDPAKFARHYETRLVLPYPVLQNLAPISIARFAEQSTSPLGVDLEIQSTRVYPHQTLAAHLLGSLRRDDSSVEGEEAFFSYRLPDFRGDIGIEYGYDKELRGTAGAKSVLVNNIGYRQTENVWSPAEPGRNIVLTIDLELQRATERALEGAKSKKNPTRGAAIVMDVQTGDILALASCPTLNPNLFVQHQGIPHDEWARITALEAQKNRATLEHYAPGSIFKTVVGLAALEAGLNPNSVFHVEPNPEIPSLGAIFVGRRKIRDTAPPGAYDFKRALKLSSNSYFVDAALKVGPERIIQLGQRFHLGERIGLPLRQETSGSFPKKLGPGWTPSDTANLSIGQAPVLVTPIQVAVLTAALANGGKVLWPRLVDRIEPQDPTSAEQPVVFASGRVRDEIGVSQRSLRVLHDAMLADTEDSDGTGRRAVVPGLRICGKTGTAQIQNVHNTKIGQTTWFASFAPYGNPRYAVVVMVEDGFSGGDTCAPVAGKIYAAILERERMLDAKLKPIAQVN